MAEGPATILEPPSERADDPALEALKFRFGFLCRRAGDRYPAGPRQVLPKAGWRYERAGPFVIHLHPETRLARRSAGERHLLLLGEAFDIATGAVPDLAPLIGADEAGFLDRVDRLSGRFALLLVEGDRLRALHDPIGSRSLYYHARAPFCLGSHAPLVARAVGAGRRADVAALLEHPAYRARQVKYLPGDWTLYEDVFGLVPNTLFDTASGAPRRYWPREPLRPADFEGFASAAAEYLRAQATFASRHLKPLLGLTGGVDTRCVIASFRAFGVPFETFTWVSDQRLAPGESALVERLAAHLAVPHCKLKTPKAVDEVARIAGRNGGAYRGPSRLTSAMAAAYGAGSGRTFIRCWGGEIMSGFYNTRQRPMRRLAPDEMARAYGQRSAPAALAAFEAVRPARRLRRARRARLRPERSFLLGAPHGHVGGGLEQRARPRDADADRPERAAAVRRRLRPAARAAPEQAAPARGDRTLRPGPRPDRVRVRRRKGGRAGDSRSGCVRPSAARSLLDRLRRRFGIRGAPEATGSR